jgi:hypothetical protein
MCAAPVEPREIEMTDPGTKRQDGRITRPKSPQKEPSQRKHSERTAGTNRDFDETEEARNQGHGHPREERGWHRE